MLWEGSLRALKERFSPQASHLSNERRAVVWLSSLSVLLLGLALTWLGCLWIWREADRSAQVYFDRHADKLEANVTQRFVRVLTAFQGLRGYFHAAGGPVKRDAFRIWVASRRIHEDLDGIRGMGFIQRVERTDLDTFLAAERHDSAPGFSIRTSGDAADLYVIKFIEPLANNERAWGFDVGSESRRREAAERAVRQGEAALTRHIALVQDGKQRPGYLFYLPVFQWATKIDTPEDRQRHLVGLIYSPIVMEEFLSGIGDVADRLVNMEVFDGDGVSEDRLTFDLRLPESGAPRFESVRRIEVGGNALTLRMRSTPAFEERYRPTSIWWFAATGGMLSVALSLTLWLLMVGRSRAEALAQGMTSDLNVAKLRAENALRDKSALLDTLNRFNLISMTDARGIIQDVNDAFCTVSGYERDELIGSSHAKVTSGVHDSGFWQRMWQTISQGEPWEGEVCNRKKGGALHWLKTTVVPLKDAEGRIERFLSIRTDITEAKRTQQAFASMAERYQLAIDGGSDGLWDWFDLRSSGMWWSPQLYRMLGYSPDEWPANVESLSTLLHPDDRERVLLAFQAALKQTTPFDLTFSVRTRAGGYRWMRCRGKTFFDPDGRPIRMAGSVQDIHDRHLAEEVIQKHSEQLSAIFSLSPDGFVSFGADGHVNYASAAYTALTGLSAESVLCLNEQEFLSQLLARCVNPPDLTSLDELTTQRQAVDPMSWLARHRLVLQLKLPVGRMLALSLYETKGDTVSRLLLLRDVTHEAEVDRMKSAFLSMAAHELRTPMASIYGFVELMLTRDMKPEKQKDLLAKVYRQCEVMISLINELLDLARIESQRGADFDIKPLSFVEVVQSVVDDFKPPLEREAPSVDVPDDGVPIRGDQMKLGQAFLNVLSNAYKYSPRGGEVKVSFPRQHDPEAGVTWVGVRVQDHGIGMSAEQLAHVGERFFRVDKSGSIPGTGLGVSIVKEILELMGGRMEVDSELGRGTTVTLWLPLDAGGVALT